MPSIIKPHLGEVRRVEANAASGRRERGEVLLLLMGAGSQGMGDSPHPA